MTAPTVYTGTACFDDFGTDPHTPKRVFFIRKGNDWIVWAARGCSLWVVSADEAKQHLHLTADRDAEGKPVKFAATAATFSKLSYVAGEYDYIDIMRIADRAYSEAAASLAARIEAEHFTYFVTGEGTKRGKRQWRVLTQVALREDAEEYAATAREKRYGWDKVSVMPIPKHATKTIEDYKLLLDEWLDICSDYAALAQG